MAAGTPRAAQRSGSQRPARMSKSMVREAFDGSLRCRPVRLKISHESTVPNATSPRAARAARSGWASRNHAILVPEK